MSKHSRNGHLGAVIGKSRLFAGLTALAMMAACVIPGMRPNAAVAQDNPAALCTPAEIDFGTDTTAVSGRDDGVATWVGRDMYIGAPAGNATPYNNAQAPQRSYAVEAEGLTLVNGKLAMNAQKHSWGDKGFRFGIVGFGSQYRSASGSDTLVVAGNNSGIMLTDNWLFSS